MMDIKNQPFFKSLSPNSYHTISIQTFLALALLISLFCVLGGATAWLLLQLRTVTKETTPFLQEKTKVASLIAQKQELIEKLEPSYSKSKKKIRILEKLNSMHLVMQKIFEQEKSVCILSCVLKNKKLTIMCKSENNDYRDWIKKIADSKLFKNIVVTHIKHNQPETQITLEGEILF